MKLLHLKLHINSLTIPCNVVPEIGLYLDDCITAEIYTDIVVVTKTWFVRRGEDGQLFLDPNAP
jgi:hypothetical protein